jgi:hypothetical protein
MSSPLIEELLTAMPRQKERTAQLLQEFQLLESLWEIEVAIEEIRSSSSNALTESTLTNLRTATERRRSLQEIFQL